MFSNQLPNYFHLHNFILHFISFFISFSSQFISTVKFFYHGITLFIYLFIYFVCRLIGCRANNLQRQIQWSHYISLVFKFYALILTCFRATFMEILLNIFLWFWFFALKEFVLVYGFCNFLVFLLFYYIRIPWNACITLMKELTIFSFHQFDLSMSVLHT